MRNYLIAVFSLFFIISCSHRITRIGFAGGAMACDTCQPVIKKMATFNNVPVKKLGTVKLGDSGFSTKCEEPDAILILKKEACAVGADIINITDEKRADVWSTCYRVEADLLKITDSAMRGKITSDPDYQNIALEYRQDQDKDRKTMMIIGGIVAGVAAGLVFGLLAFN